MSIDFFTQGMRTSSVSAEFGLCDDTDGQKKSPAYIDEKDSPKWIAEVHNPFLKQVDFYAIDSCVSWSESNGKVAKACDGMLSYNQRQNILFVELKNRNPEYKQWRIKAEEQLKSTIVCFRQNHTINNVHLKAYVCNKQALFEVGEEEFLEKFKAETGVTLRVYREIEII